MKRSLALDLDELMYPFLENLIVFVNERRGTHFVKDDFFTYDFEQVWGGTSAEAVTTVNDYFTSLGRDPEPIEGSVDAVARLAEMFELYVVTARHDALEEMTFEWLSLHFPDLFAGIHLCNLYGTNPVAKALVCEEVDVVALVDDSLFNVTDVARRGRRGVLFGQFAWNAAEHLPEGVTRALDWDDVIIEVKELA